MKISLVSVSPRSGRGRLDPEEVLVAAYLKRASHFTPAEGSWVETEAHLWKRVAGSHGRTSTRVILMDASGRLCTSVEFADLLRDLRDRGTQQLVFGIGGADGWSEESRSQADLSVSMGRMTLPHGLARVVAAEQIYRAMTILAGHPYHSGH